MNFINDLNLHDAIILELSFQSNNDYNDCIKIFIKSINFIKVYKTEYIELTIEECFKVKANMNMWITGQDSIREFQVYKKSNWIDEELKTNKLTPKCLNHAILELNTSASKFEFLITKDIRVTPIKPVS
jgi:hypothetical protein